MIRLFQHQQRWRIALLLGVSLAGVASLFYTNWLAQQLAQREERQMDIYVKAQKSILQEDGSLIFLVNEIVQNNSSIPIIVVRQDSVATRILDTRNVNIPEGLDSLGRYQYLQSRLRLMQAKYAPIALKADGFAYLFYYTNSPLIGNLQYFPLVQIAVVLIFGVLGYLVFSSTREAEQNRLWAGLAKETAHQLGTPISGLLAWVDLLRTDENLDQDIVDELEKDVNRLSIITERFSSIGSEPQLDRQDVGQVLCQTVSYLERRVSKHVQIQVDIQGTKPIEAPLNEGLFAWVIENLVKNAVDAMSGRGAIKIRLHQERDHVVVSVKDQGKGISEKHLRRIFDPGFSTKKSYAAKRRGWGLGLTLVKRIVENYHRGKISVKSELHVGTTFKIRLPH
ncbi:MAG: sensor histidine kinase [Bernardetiaceae bacterium]